MTACYFAACCYRSLLHSYQLLATCYQILLASHRLLCLPLVSVNVLMWTIWLAVSPLREERDLIGHFYPRLACSLLLARAGNEPSRSFTSRVIRREIGSLMQRSYRTIKVGYRSCFQQVGVFSISVKLRKCSFAALQLGK